MPQQHGHEKGTEEQPDDEDRRVGALAKSLDCLTEGDLAALAKVKLDTLEAWRKRHKGPPYILLGNRYLYPRSGVRKFMARKTRNASGEVGE